MILCDINVLLYAYREDAPNYPAYNAWINNMLNSDEPYGVVDLVQAGFLRIITHPRIYKIPTPLSEAMAFMQLLREQPHAVVIHPGPQHWDIFRHLCEKTQARGPHVTDAYLAALAIEHGCEWVTTDRDYSRYPGLRWRHPLE